MKLKQIISYFLLFIAFFIGVLLSPCGGAFTFAIITDFFFGNWLHSQNLPWFINNIARALIFYLVFISISLIIAKYYQRRKGINKKDN